VWAFGGALDSGKAADWRKQFSDFWRADVAPKTSARFPDEGLVFDYTVELETCRFVHWRERVPAYTHVRDAPFAAIVVPTIDTTRLGAWIELLSRRQRPVMLVGNAGSAKTTVLADRLRSLPDEVISCTVNFNSFTDASALQFMLEQPLEKKTGTTYGPPGTKRLTYVLDDFNMPSPDAYGTQSAIALLRQQVDYGGWFDLKKLSMKTVQDVQYLAAMNPTAGSFAIVDRMQRHFATFACPFPDADVLRSIYGTIVSGHLASFAPEVSRMGEQLVGATLGLHREVADSFLPTMLR
jgi:dynein heavy chain